MEEQTVHCKNELHLMHFCNGTYLSQNHEHLRHIKHIRYKITVTCSTFAMPQAHGALYITSAKIGWGAWSASCMGISRYLLCLTRMEWNWAPPQAHGSCTMRLNILHPCAWCEHRFYSVLTILLISPPFTPKRLLVLNPHFGVPGHMYKILPT